MGLVFRNITLYGDSRRLGIEHKEIMGNHGYRQTQCHPSQIGFIFSFSTILLLLTCPSSSTLFSAYGVSRGGASCTNTVSSSSSSD